MADALQYLYYIYDKFVDFVFNTMAIDNGITYGWIILSIVIFSIMIRSILNLPRGINFRRRSKNE